MSRPDTHVVHVERQQNVRVARKVPGTTWSRWVCTCGRRSKLFGFAGLAEQAGRTHAEAHGGHMDAFATRRH